MRVKNALEYLGIWAKLDNPAFKGGEFDPLLSEAGSNPPIRTAGGGIGISVG